MANGGTVLAILSAGLLLVAPVFAQQANEPAGGVSILLVQQAQSATYDGEVLTLHGVPATFWFSDRPERRAGRLNARDLVNAWRSDGPFASDSPNAALTTTVADEEQTIIITLDSAETVNGNGFRYEVTSVSGILPPSMEDVALFIDPAGQQDGTQSFMP